MIHRNYDIKNSTMEIISGTTNSQLKISNSAYFVEVFTIEINKDYSTSNYTNFRIYTGGVVLYDIPFDLLYKLSKIMFYNDKCRIILPNELYMKYIITPIPIQNLVYHTVGATLVSNITTTYNLHLRYIDSEDYMTSISMIPRRIIKNELSAGLYQIQQYYHKPFASTNSAVFALHNGIQKPHGCFIETMTPNKNLSIYLDNICICNPHTLKSYNIQKNIWTQHKSEVFNIIMEKILPYEMIHNIEEYIDNTYNTYICYIPINYDFPEGGCCLEKNNNTGCIKTHNHNKLIIDFGNNVDGNIYYVYNYRFYVMNGMGTFIRTIDYS